MTDLCGKNSYNVTVIQKAVTLANKMKLLIMVT